MMIIAGAKACSIVGREHSQAESHHMKQIQLGTREKRGGSGDTGGGTGHTHNVNDKQTCSEGDAWLT